MTANSLSKVYGAALPALTYTYTGLVNGDTPPSFHGVLSTSATAGSVVGTYPVTQGTLSAGPNYAISFSAGTLTITAAALTLTSDSLGKVYGAALPALSYTYSGPGQRRHVVRFHGHAGDRGDGGEQRGRLRIDRGRSRLGRTTRSARRRHADRQRGGAGGHSHNLSKVYGAALPALSYTYSGSGQWRHGVRFHGHVGDTGRRRARCGQPIRSAGDAVSGRNYSYHLHPAAP